MDAAFFAPPLPTWRDALVNATGAQFASLDAFTAGADVNENYVDGVSITARVAGVRNHLFSLAIGLTDAIRQPGSPKTSGTPTHKTTRARSARRPAS